MDQREKFLSEVTDTKASVTAVSRLFGITRQTGHKWIRRWKRERSLEEKSRRPKSQPATTPPAVVKRILAMKRKFPRWGPVQLRKRLQDLWPDIDWPAPSTIGAILLERLGKAFG
jgi:transposase-like protein